MEYIEKKDEQLEPVDIRPPDASIRKYTGKSLGLWSIESTFRRNVVAVVDSTIFDSIILMAIVANCVFLAMDSANRPQDGAFNTMLQVGEYVFLAVFSIEMVLKIIASGLVIGPHTYLRDPWNRYDVSPPPSCNRLDFAVVMLGYVSLLPSVGNYTAFRTFRVLRALKALSKGYGIKVVVASLLDSLSGVFNAVAVCCFFIAVFAILGVQMFGGDFRRRCYFVDTGLLDLSQSLCGIAYECNAGTVCQTWAENPYFGITNFDNFGWASLTVVQLILRDSWENTMGMLLMTSSKWVALYLVFVVMFGGLFVVNLVLAVVSNAYQLSRQARAVEQARAFVEFTAIEQEVRIRQQEDLERIKKPPSGSNRRRVYDLVQSNAFSVVVIIVIVLNIICMVVEYPEMPELMATITRTANFMFTIFFAVEMLLKIFGLGPRLYALDKMNVFDAVIVAFSMLELLLADASTGLSVLRAFRLLRVFKLMRRWKSLRSLLLTIIRSVSALGSVSVVTVLCLFIFAVLGMQIFGGKYHFVTEDGEVTRTNFDDFYHAFMSVFRMLCGEWYEPMADGVRAVGPWAVIFFLFAVFMGIMLIFNLFLAILFDNFDQEREEESKQEPEPEPELELPESTPQDDVNASTKSHVTRHVRHHAPEGYDMPVDHASHRGLVHQDSMAEIKDIQLIEIESKPIEQPETTETNKKQVNDTKPIHKTQQQHSDVTLVPIPQPTTSLISEASQQPESEPTSPVATVAPGPDTKKRHVQLGGKSFRLFSGGNKFRLMCQSIVEYKRFEAIVMTMIFVSSGLLALEEPGLDENSTMGQVLGVCNVFFAIVFTCEMLLKMVVYGAVVGPETYLHNGWNVLDFCIVTVSIISLFPAASGLAFIRVIRALRAFRPLRMIGRNESMRIIVNALLRSIPSIANVLIVCLLFFVVFGILGVQLFGGKFHYCNDAAILHKNDCVGMYYDGEQMVEREWLNKEQRFDYILDALMSEMELATFEGFMTIVWNGVDASGYDTGPIRDYNPLVMIYFISFLIVGGFFVVNLFVGVIVDSFNQLRNEGMLTLTESQKKWIDTQSVLMQNAPRKVPKRPNSWRKYVYDVVITKQFESSVMIVILLNFLAMTLEHYDQNEQFSSILRIVNIAFVAIFTLEAAFKMTGVGMEYFEDSWNKFDLLVVVVSIITLIAELFLTELGFNPTLFRMLRLFRISRILRLMRSFKQLRRLIFTLIFALPSMANIAILLSLCVYIYSVLGMFLFGQVIRGDALTEQYNFENFGNSLITVFRLSSGAGWNDLMRDCSATPELSGCSYELNNCGQPVVSRFYYLSLCIIINFVMLNLFIAVILENFEYTTQQERSKIKDEDLEKAKFDPTARQTIDVQLMVPFLRLVGDPIGLPGMLSLKEELTLVDRMNIPVHDGKVHFLEVLLGCSRRVLGAYEELPADVESKVMERRANKFPSLGKLSKSTAYQTDSRMLAAVLRLQRFYHMRHDRKKKLQGSGVSSASMDVKM